MDNEFNEAFQLDAVKNEPCYGNNSSSSKTDFVEHVADSHQEQNEKNIDEKNLIQKDLGNSEFLVNFSTSSCNTVGIKNDIDTVYENIKLETVEDKPSEGNGFCEVCYQSFEGDTSYRSECSCQIQNDSQYYNIPGQDMAFDVKPLQFDSTTDLVLNSLKVQVETISGDEVTKEQDLSAVLRGPSVSPTEYDHKMKRKFCSEPLENNVSMPKKENQCKSCPKSFRRPSELKSHERIHTGEKPFQCKICSKSFSKFDSLNDHTRVHTGEKPFHCKICSKSFSLRGILKYHESTHASEKPFRCNICFKFFKRMRVLKLHERVHTGERPFHCKICSKSFTQGCILKRHERSHVGDKLFHCKICSKSFSLMGSLKTHERVHTGEKPFNCKICSKSFSLMGSLKVHERVHTGEKPFHCEICSQSFTQQSNLKVHWRKHTGEQPFDAKFVQNLLPNKVI